MIFPGQIALEREAKRIYLRYAVEVIEAFGLCPWARTAREEGRVALRVALGMDPNVMDVLPHVLAADRSIEHDVTIVIMPLCTLGGLELQHFAAALRQAYEAKVGRSEAALAIADFHPDAVPDMSSPERLVPFIRRSPDPTLQLVRHSALEAARNGGGPEGTRFIDQTAVVRRGSSPPPPPSEPLAQRVARANARTLDRVGIECLQAIVTDIARDRRLSYAALLQHTE